jgi:hypothetical protein
MVRTDLFIYSLARRWLELIYFLAGRWLELIYLLILLQEGVRTDIFIFLQEGG